MIHLVDRIYLIIIMNHDTERILINQIYDGLVVGILQLLEVVLQPLPDELMFLRLEDVGDV